MTTDPKPPEVSRRSMLKGATVIAAAGGAALAGAQPASPAVLTGSQTGRSFRAFVRHGAGSSIETLKLLPIQPRQVVIRNEASAPCYTIVRGILGTAEARRASVPNHAGFGVVEAVGSQVKRVQPGDRVVVAGTSQCGQCYQCLQGRADFCQFTWGGVTFPAFAEMADKTPVFADVGIGGLAEVMVVTEEYCCPVFSDLPAEELTLLGDQLATGFCAGFARMRFEPGCDVAIFGAGPVGLGSVQAGRVLGADQIIVVEPIKYRREMALKLGATTVIDPTGKGDAIVEEIRELCKGPNDRLFSGQVGWAKGNAIAARGADFAIEAAGVQAFVPKVEPQPDPTNVSTVRHTYDCTRQGGHAMMMGLTTADVPLGGLGLALFGRTIHSGQQGGMHMMRDIPRMVKLMEKGVIDSKTIISKRYTIDQTRQSVQDCADRTIVTGVIKYS